MTSGIFVQALTKGRRAFPAHEKRGQQYAKTHIIVPVVRIVPVAVGTTHVPLGIVV